MPVGIPMSVKLPVHVFAGLVLESSTSEGRYTHWGRPGRFEILSTNGSDSTELLGMASLSHQLQIKEKTVKHTYPGFQKF